MSRLDDELKIAYRRQEPSPDFAARVLARLNEAPVPQPRLTVWQRLAGMWSMPALRWATAGAMALLLIIIGVALLRAQRTAGVENNSLTVANSTANPSGADRDAASKKSGGNPTEKSSAPDSTNAVASSVLTPGGAALPSHSGGGHRRISSHAPVAVRQPQPSAEAEAAKEQVLFALQITSKTLNEAQRAIADDRRDDKPEPVPNR